MRYWLWWTLGPTLSPILSSIKNEKTIDIKNYQAVKTIIQISESLPGPSERTG